MSRSALAHERSRSSARLGLTLRSILTGPREGFEAATHALERRDRTREHVSLGMSVHALAALGGAALMLLWLKVGGMADVRSSPSGRFSWMLLVVALAVGAGIALAAQMLWSLVSARVIRSLGGGAGSVDLRLVWSAAALPQSLALALLLPLDVLLVGPSAFTARPVLDSVSRTWAAISVALGLALALWSLYLFVRGVEIMAGLRLLRATAATAFAGATFALCALAFAAALRLVAELGP